MSLYSGALLRVWCVWGLLTLSWRTYASILVSVPPQAPVSALKNVVQDNFIGISWELSSFDTLWGSSVNDQPVPMQNYLGNIKERMSNPLRIRIGGNGMDGSTYVPDQPEPVIIQPNPIKTGSRGDDFVPVNFSSSFLDLLNGMSNKVGEMQFCLGLTMRHTQDFSNAALLGADAQRILGNRLDAFILGNEPDLYSSNGVHPEGYTIPNYISDVGVAMNALASAGVKSSNPILSGPTTCCNWNLKDVIDAGLDKDGYKYYNIQKYPNNACSGINAQNTNITYYLTHANVGAYLGAQLPGIDEAIASGVPTILSEFNTVSCGGSNVSSTFAASLWTIDVGLQAAALNYSAVFIHTRELGVQYNLFDPPSPGDNGGSWRTGSPYYGVLFLSESISPNGSVIVDLNLDNSTTDQQATIVGYAIYDHTGASPRQLALLNMASEEQTFTLPPGLSDQVQYKVLTAPSVTERTNISWANQTVGGNGLLEGNEVINALGCSTGCDLAIPGPGAVLVSLAGSGEAMFNGASSTGAAGPSPAATEASPMKPKQTGSGRRSYGVAWMNLLGFVCFLALYMV